MNHGIRCECGALRGFVIQPRDVLNRGICYCGDCQDYARILAEAAQTLDANGGTEVIAVSPRNVVFTHGLDRLSCLSLSGKGLLRWHASCCNTPIGNTPRNIKVSFVGLVHNCLEHSEQTIEQSFGPVSMWVHRNSAIGKITVKPNIGRAFLAIVRIIKGLLLSRLSGNYKITPFFIEGSGNPIRAPRVVSPAERAAAGTACALRD